MKTTPLRQKTGFSYWHFRSELLGSIFDFGYLVHPSEFDPRIAEMVGECTPIGLATINYGGVREVVQARLNPFVSPKVKDATNMGGSIGKGIRCLLV